MQGKGRGGMRLKEKERTEKKGMKEKKRVGIRKERREWETEG